VSMAVSTYAAAFVAQLAQPGVHLVLGFPKLPSAPAYRSKGSPPPGGFRDRHPVLGAEHHLIALLEPEALPDLLRDGDLTCW